VPVVCIASIPPGALAHTRYLCKRLRSYHSEVKIVVGRWGLHGEAKPVEEHLRAAGADQVDRTLVDTTKHLDSWWPVFASRGEAAPSSPADATAKPTHA
jgi:hypothetical protein